MKEKWIKHQRITLPSWCLTDTTCTCSELKNCSASSAPGCRESVNGSSNAAASACHPVNWGHCTEEPKYRDKKIWFSHLHHKIWASFTKIQTVFSGMSGYIKRTYHWTTELRILQSRQSQNNINMNTREDYFFLFEGWGLGFFLREESSQRKTFRHTAPSGWAHGILISAKNLPRKTYQKTWVTLLTWLFIIGVTSDTSHATTAINKAPPLLSQPPQALRGCCRGCPPQQKPRSLAAEWLQFTPFWKVTHFPSPDSIIKPKRSGITVRNYCLGWNGTVKPYHLFAPEKLKGKITISFHTRTHIAEGLKNIARFYCLTKYLQWYIKAQKLLLWESPWCINQNTFEKLHRIFKLR